MNTANVSSYHLAEAAVVGRFYRQLTALALLAVAAMYSLSEHFVFEGCRGTLF